MEVTLEELAARLDDPSLTIVDVRTEGEFTGVRRSPFDPRHGHIPGALNVEVAALLQATPDELRAWLGPPGETEIVCYCHTGQRSAVAAAALAAAGYRASNYAGSWYEWSRHPELPLEA